MDVPFAIVKGKAALGKLVNMKVTRIVDGFVSFFFQHNRIFCHLCLVFLSLSILLFEIATCVCLSQNHSKHEHDLELLTTSKRGAFNEQFPELRKKKGESHCGMKTRQKRGL